MTAIAPSIRSLTSAVSLARPEILALVPVSLGLVLRLRKAWADMPTIVLEATSDDAFYYFQIARNIATGHNVTFDGETLTNGFHPLWMALLTPALSPERRPEPSHTPGPDPVGAARRGDCLLPVRHRQDAHL